MRRQAPSGDASTGFAAEKFGVPAEQVDFRDNHVHIGPRVSNQTLEFSELAKLCWLGRVSLSATGFYRTPDLHWNREQMTGSPFFYFSFGASELQAASLVAGGVEQS